MKLNDCIKEVICIEENFSVGCLCIYIECGANNEDREKSGLSHLCEHFFIKLVTNQYNKSSDDKFSCMGYTDYMYTTIIITYMENYTNLLNIIKAINIKEFNIDNGKTLFDQCKKEIVKECLDRESDIKISTKVNSLITNKLINYVPLGNIKAIENIKYAEFVEFFLSNYYTFHCAFLLNNSYDLNNYYLKKKRKNIFKNYFKNIFNSNSKNSIYEISDQNKQKIYFTIKSEILVDNISLALVEFILTDIIETELGINVYFMKKRISDICIFEILCINSRQEKISNNIIKLIKNFKIKESDLIYAKKEFLSQLQSNYVVDLNYAINNIINYFVYGEKLLLSKEQIQKSILDIEKIKLKKLNTIKNKIFNYNYWTLIGY